MVRTYYTLIALLLLNACARAAPPRAEAPAPEDEVSVGYGTRAKRTGTGPITSVALTEADGRMTRIEDLLQARFPGLQVIRLPSGGYSLRIRGRTSLVGGPTHDEPLLVIDGQSVPEGALGSTLAALAPRDVARIDVLKDAGATAIYGARAAGGVIIITTKRARPS